MNNTFDRGYYTSYNTFTSISVFYVIPTISGNSVFDLQKPLLSVFKIKLVFPEFFMLQKVILSFLLF